MQKLHEGVTRVAHSSMKLHGAVRDLPSSFGRGDLGLRSTHPKTGIGRVHPDRVERQQGGQIELETHPGDSVSSELLVRQQTSHDGACRRVAHSQLEGLLAHAERLCRDADAALGQGAEGDPLAVADTTENSALIDHELLVGELAGSRSTEAVLLLVRLATDLRVVHVDQEGRPAAPVFAADAEDDREVSDRTVRDPGSRAVQDELVAILAAAADLAVGVASSIGFGQSVASEQLSSSHLRQVVSALLISTVHEDRKSREGALRTEHHRGRGAGRSDLAHRDELGEPREAGAAIRLRAVEPEEAEFGQLGAHLGSEDVEFSFVDCEGVRAKLALTEVAEHVAQHARIFV